MLAYSEDLPFLTISAILSTLRTRVLVVSFVFDPHLCWGRSECVYVLEFYACYRQRGETHKLMVGGNPSSGVMHLYPARRGGIWLACYDSVIVIFMTL